LHLISINDGPKGVLGVNARDMLGLDRDLVSPSKSIFSDLGSLGLKLNEAEGKVYEDFLIVSVKISSLDFFGQFRV